MKLFFSRFLASCLLAVLVAEMVIRAIPKILAAELGEILFRYQMRTGLVLTLDELDPTKVNAELKRIGDEVKDFATKALADIKKNGEISAETRKKVDDALVTQGELQARLTAAEQLMAKIEKAAQEEPAKPKSLGQMFVDSDEFKDFKAAGGLIHSRAACVMRLNAALSGLSEASGGALVQPDRIGTIVELGSRRMTVRDLMAPGRTSSNMIEYVRELDFTNNAAAVSETVAKPQSNLTFELVQQAVITIAHYLKASKQILDDAPMLQSFIDFRLRYGLKFVEETQLLKGSGVGNNLEGIYTAATAYAAPIDPPGTETRIDVIRLMLLQAELAEFPATGIVLHPSDWAAIELTKDTTGAYIFANPQSLAQPALWGRPVVSTQAMTVDTALVGAFRAASQIFDKEDANVSVATQNEDDFIKNMITVRCEERLASAIYRPEAFIKNTNLPS